LKSNWLCRESDVHKKVRAAQLKLQEDLSKVPQEAAILAQPSEQNTSVDAGPGSGIPMKRLPTWVYEV
jgi:hypothetical protein